MMCLLGKAQNHWVPNIYQFPTNMTVTAVVEINGIEQQNSYLELGVFCEDDCRGSQILSYFDDPINRYLLFLVAFGNTGDMFTFRLYDHLTGQELELVSENEISFQSNAILGDVLHPYVFSFTGSGEVRVNVMAEPETGGQVTGGGYFSCGSYCRIVAEPVEGATFLGWMMNGDTITTESDYFFNAVADMDFTAYFELPVVPEIYEIVAYVDPPAGGTVTGDGSFEEGSLCILKVESNPHYVFVNWTEDGEEVSTDSVYSFEVTRDRTLVANLSYVNEINEDGATLFAFPNPTTGKVRLSLGEERIPVRVYDLQGMRVMEGLGNELDLSDQPDGVYVIKVGGKVFRVIKTNP